MISEGQFGLQMILTGLNTDIDDRTFDPAFLFEYIRKTAERQYRI